MQDRFKLDIMLRNENEIDEIFANRIREEKIRPMLENIAAKYLNNLNGSPLIKSINEKLIESEILKTFEIKQTKLPRKLKKKYKKERRICFDMKIY